MDGVLARIGLALLTVAGVAGSAAAQAVVAGVDVPQAQYQPGETLRVAVSLASTGAADTADVYVVLQLPGSAQAVSLGLGAPPTFGSLAALQSLVPAARGINLAGAFSVRVDPFFEYTWTGAEPLGEYVLHLAVVRAGALADGAISAGELFAYATEPFAVDRPLVEVLQPTARNESLIEPQGGSLATTAADGTGITVVVPPGALTAAAPIAITPVSGITNLPLSGTLRAAVRLEPDGLQLARPATVTLDLPEGTPASGLVGFLYSGTGQGFEVLPVAVSGNTVSLEVSHFSTAGVVTGTEADFITQVTPLVNGLPATLPVTQVESLVSQLVAWVGRFGVGLCDASKPAARALCTSVYSKGVTSLATHLAATCQQVSTAVQANEPFTAFDSVSPLLRLVSRLAELRQLGSELGLITVTPGAPELSCLATSLRAIVPVAEAEGRQRLLAVIADTPPIPRMDAALQLLQNIAANAAAAGSVDIQNLAIQATGRLMTELLPQAQALCATEPFRADALLFRPVQLFGAPFLNALGPALGDQFEIAAAGCRVTVTPNGATLAPGAEVQFSATLADPDGFPSTFVWQVQGLCGGSISPSGLFTAGPSAETCQILAAVPPSGPLASRRPFFKVVDVVTRSAVVVTARSIRASKGLRAGTNTAQFTAGPFTVIQPRTEAFVDAQALTAKQTDPLSGTANVVRSAIVLDAPVAQENRVITGNATLGASTTGDADAAVSLASSLSATFEGTFDCTLQVSTSGVGVSSARVRLTHGGATIFDATTSGVLTAVCSPGAYTLTADADGEIVLGGSASRTLSYTLTLTPRAAP